MLVFIFSLHEEVAGENSRHFVTPPTTSPRNDIWETGAEIPYWWHVITQIWVRASDWLKQISHAALPIRSTSQIWVVTLSSVWNFCAHFSDVISQGNRWWRPEISAVFSGYFLMKWVKCLAILYSLLKQLNFFLRSSRFTVQFSVN